MSQRDDGVVISRGVCPMHNCIELGSYKECALTDSLTHWTKGCKLVFVDCQGFYTWRNIPPHSFKNSSSSVGWLVYLSMCVCECVSMYLSSVKDDDSLCAFLVHDSVSAFSTSNGVSWTNLVLGVTFAANVDHGRLGRRPHAPARRKVLVHDDSPT